jgi:hypothetical protein
VGVHVKKRLIVGIAAFGLLGASLLPAAAAAPVVASAGVAPAGVEAIANAAVETGDPTADLAARMKKAKKDRENQVTQAERLRAAKKSGIKAPVISRTQLQLFAANQDALNGVKTKSVNKNLVTPGGVTPHYFGPYSNYANSPQHLSTAIVDFGAPANVPWARKATGTAIVDNAGVVTDILITDPGAGYDPATPPTVTVTGIGGTGSGAAVTSTVGVVLDRVDITSAGDGYNDPVTVNFAGGALDTNNPLAHQAVAVASITYGGVITAITVTDFGAGYTQPPTATATDDAGQFVPAILAPVMSFGVTAVTIGNGGSGYVLPGMRKFVDELPIPGYVNDPNKHLTNLGQYLGMAVADTTTYPGSDYYMIAVVQYREQLHSDLPKTLLRGYVQLAPAGTPGAVALTNALVDGTTTPALLPDGTQAFGYDSPHYLGPVITAEKDRPTRVLFRNLLPTGVKGDLFLPVDTTVVGAGQGSSVTPTAANNWGYGADPVNPVCGQSGAVKPKSCYTENRSNIHLDGGATPWISDGTPHQWITPAGQATDYPEGVSVKNVPDMADPGPGAQTFFYTNQQSARLMFYHDRSWGITRLNVYAGETAAYSITDASERKLQTAGIIPDASSTIPLIIEDKTFVPTTAELSVTDPLWNEAAWGSKGNLWASHTYMSLQNPYDATGTNQFGRWEYGPWFWPPTTTLIYGPRANPYAGQCIADWCEPAGWLQIPGTPNESAGFEAYNDTPLVNGTAYPKVTLEPKAYRFKVLNASNDRFWNLQLYQATGNSADGSNCEQTTGANCTEVAMNASEIAAAQADPFVFPTPDTFVSPAGPVWNMIGTESGWLAQPAVIPQQPITWVTDPTVFNAGNVDKHSLVLAPAQRADVVVDFSTWAGKTLIMYNDAPAAYPARDPRYDYYTDNADLRNTGGANTTPAGYGPNTRTVMAITIAAKNATGGTGPTFALSKANKEWMAKTLGGGGLFEDTQPPIVVGQSAYNRAYDTAFGTDKSIMPNDGFIRINDSTVTFNTLTNAGPGKPGAVITMNLEMKGMHDEMGAGWDNMFGRMAGMMGLEAPNNTAAGAQNLVLYPYVNPPTENFDGLPVPAGIRTVPIVTLGDGTQIWKLTHNGVITHPMNFPLADVQLINRVGWDGIIRPPEDSELGWQNTVRVSPLEDTFVAIRPILPQTTFGIPVSKRPLNPALPIGSPDGFISFDANGNAITPAYTNEVTNLDWEYVWGNRMLSIADQDMMRPVSVKAPAVVPDPSVLTGAAGVLTWTDPTAANLKSTWGNPKNEIGWKIMRAQQIGMAVPAAADYVQIGKALANATTFTVPGADPSLQWVYKVVAWNAAGETDSNTVGMSTSTAVSMLAADWLVVGGAPTQVALTGPMVKIGSTGGEYRVVNKVPWTKADTTLSTTADQTVGNGYGIFLRLTRAGGSITSAYGFQVDPGAGKALVLRQWAGNKEICTLARQTYPATFLPSNPHTVVASIVGDTFTATITWAGGSAVMSVPSLVTANANAVGAPKCPTTVLPTGKDFGFRTWTAGTTTFVGTTVG